MKTFFEFLVSFLVLIAFYFFILYYGRYMALILLLAVASAIVSGLTFLIKMFLFDLTYPLIKDYVLRKTRKM